MKRGRGHSFENAFPIAPSFPPRIAPPSPFPPPQICLLVAHAAGDAVARALASRWPEIAARRAAEGRFLALREWTPIAAARAGNVAVLAAMRRENGKVPRRISAAHTARENAVEDARNAQRERAPPVLPASRSAADRAERRDERRAWRCGREWRVAAAERARVKAEKTLASAACFPLSGGDVAVAAAHAGKTRVLSWILEKSIREFSDGKSMFPLTECIYAAASAGHPAAVAMLLEDSVLSRFSVHPSNAAGSRAVDAALSCGSLATARILHERTGAPCSVSGARAVLDGGGGKKADDATRRWISDTFGIFAEMQSGSFADDAFTNAAVVEKYTGPPLFRPHPPRCGLTTREAPVA